MSLSREKKKKRGLREKNYKLTNYRILPSTGPRKIKAKEEGTSVLKSQQTQAGLLKK